MIVIDNKEKSVENGQKDTIILVLPSKPEYVSVARLTVSGIASRMGFDIEEVEDIKLAVAEACTNAIKHGYKECPGEYEVKASVEGNCLSISVSDKGCGFEMENVKCPDCNNLKEGGMGLFIIRTLMDDAELENVSNAGCTLNMKKYLGV